MSGAVDARAAVLDAIAADRVGVWTPTRVETVTGMPRAEACQLLIDMAAEGQLEGKFQRYVPTRGATPSPWRALDHAASWLSPGLPQLDPFDLEQRIIDATRKPGRPGVRACVNLRRSFPNHVWPGLLPIVFRAKPNVAGWQLLLSQAWTNEESGSSLVVEAAGTHDALVRWFRYANYSEVRVPLVRQLICLDVPDDIVLFRGGQGCARQLSLGWSWTTDRAIAGFYAGRGVRAGSPVIIRRVGNAGALMRRLVFTREVTIDPRTHGDAVVVDTSDPVEIAELVVAVEQKEPERRAVREQLQALSDAELLAGYDDP